MKKIFCIFAVVLILIMATVPCFAVSDPTVYVVCSGDSAFKINGQLAVWYLGILTFHSTELAISELSSNFNYYYSINGDSVGTLTNSQVLNLSDGDVLSIGASSYGSYPLLHISNSDCLNLSYNFSNGFTSDFNFDLPNLWIYRFRTIYVKSSEFVDFQDSIQYLDYSFSGVSNTSISVYKLSHFYEPYFDFHNNVLSNVFSYFSDLTGSYLPLFIFFIGILFVLMIIMIIYLVIRRCCNV